MHHQWFSNLPKDKQDDFKKQVLGSILVLDKAAEIVYNMSITESKSSSKDYTSPSWAYLQAHQNGRIEALNEIYSLLKLKET